MLWLQASLLVMALSTGMSPSASAGVADDVRLASAASAESVTRIYGGKSWLWKDGAGFFRPDGRFFAWSRQGGVPSYATGLWSATKEGELCFSGTWRSTRGAAYATTCFMHRKSGATVYQIKETKKAEWYIFKHESVQPGDEYSKVVDGDTTHANFIQVVAAVGSPKPAVKRRVVKSCKSRIKC